MKKFVLAGVVSSLLMANCIDVVDNLSSVMNPCKKSGMGDSVITTKVAGSTFDLSLIRNPGECFSKIGVGSPSSNITVTLVDMETGNEIASTTSTAPGMVSFNVDEAYKNVKAKVNYSVVNVVPHEEEIACMSSVSSLAKSIEELGGKSGIYAKRVGMMKKFKCYKVTFETTTTSYEEYSTDDFAIRPDRFEVALAKSSAKVGGYIPMSVKAVNSKDATTTTYSKKSTELNLGTAPDDLKIQYSFDIQNGVSKNANLYFTQEGTAKLYLNEKVGDEFAIIDSDDTKESYVDMFGSTHYCRLIGGESGDVTINGISRYWAGTGTGEDENDPQKTSISVSIVQNTKKDLHFQKMGW